VRDVFEAEIPQPVDEQFRPDQGERAHCGHVKRPGQRSAQADHTLELPVVVLRHVQTARRNDVDRRIIEQRCGGKQALLERQLVEERFERGAGLTRGLHPVHIARG